MKLQDNQSLAFYLRPQLYDAISYRDKAMVIIDNDVITLKSENYVLAEYDKKSSVMVKRNCDKRLTFKHLNDFLFQFGFEPQDQKDLTEGTLITKNK